MERRKAAEPEMAAEAQCQGAVHRFGEVQMNELATGVRLGYALAAVPEAMEMHGPPGVLIRAFKRAFQEGDFRFWYTPFPALAPNLIFHTEALLAKPGMQIRRHRGPFACSPQPGGTGKLVDRAELLQRHLPFLAVIDP